MRIQAGRFHGRALPIASETVRPAGARLRTSLFSVLGPRLEGARVLDVCAGAGALGLEALSRGAAHVTLLDRDARVVAALAAWLATVGAAGEGEALRVDAVGGDWPRGPFDVILLDPPFPAWAGGEAQRLVERARAVVTPAGLLVVKLPRRQALEPGPRWTLRDRRDVAEVSYALLDPR